MHTAAKLAKDKGKTRRERRMMALRPQLIEAMRLEDFKEVDRIMAKWDNLAFNQKKRIPA